MAIKISGNTVIDDDNNLVNLESATFTGTSYLKLPSGDASTRPESPLNGTIRYNNASGFLETRSNDNWDILGSFDIRLSGGSQLYANVPNFFLISNYDSRRVYNVSTTNGTISITDDLILYVPENTGPGGFTVNNRTYSGTVIAGNPPGQAEFTTVGEHEFTVPYGVNKISAVVIGGGGGGADDTTNGACGGNGGNLVYANNIPVTPNELLSVYVGKGGLGSTNGTSGQKGEDSYISRPNEIILSAFGGLGGGTGTTVTNQPNEINLYVNGLGGTGGAGTSTYDSAGGGGGAAGYGGNGGNGGTYDGTSAAGSDATPNSGGGGGGASTTGTTDVGGGGGGANIYGPVFGNKSENNYNEIALGSYSVQFLDTFPAGIFFKSDGTKMYMIGDSSNRVYQLSLSTAWDVSTASYDGVSFLVSSQASEPYDVHFKPDGTKMYVLDISTDRVYQYTLSTAWDISTASYDSVSFQTPDSGPRGIFFKPDGTVIYGVGIAGDIVYQNTLSTAWDLSSYSSAQTFNVSSQDGTPEDVFFKSDGSKMYILGGSTERVYQYSLSTAWDVSTASYDSVSFSVISQDSSPRGIFFKSDGTKMYMIGTANDKVHQYSLSTAWDLTTTSIYNSSYVYITGFSSIRDLAFKSDGTKMYVLDGLTPGTIYQYTANTAWDAKSSSYDSVSYNIQTTNDSPEAIAFKSDGTILYALDTRGLIQEHTVSTPWDLSTATYSGVSVDIVGVESTYVYDFFFKPDGTKIYAINNSEQIFQYSLSTPWDISTATYDSIVFNGGTTFSNRLNFKLDGSKLFTFNYTTGEIKEYLLSTPWDITTANYFNTYDMGLVPGSSHTPFEFNSDLSRLFAISKNSDSTTVEPLLQIDLFEPEVFYYELGGKGPFAYGLSGSTGAQSGFSGLVDPTRGDGGLYGGGGAAASLQTGRTAGNGAQGAVRIIWGNGRSYPSTNVGDV